MRVRGHGYLDLAEMQNLREVSPTLPGGYPGASGWFFMLQSGTDPESYFTAYTLVYEEKWPV